MSSKYTEGDKSVKYIEGNKSVKYIEGDKSVKYIEGDKSVKHKAVTKVKLRVRSSGKNNDNNNGIYGALSETQLV